MDFNPRSPWGERPGQSPTSVKSFKFQSTLPVGGATHLAKGIQRFLAISIHAPRGGSDADNIEKAKKQLISIHAPRGGSDEAFLDNLRRPGDFNPRSPWGERRQALRCRMELFNFNPRSPWGERPRLQRQLRHFRHFNPRSPWGERRANLSTRESVGQISIHAPRGGSDPVWVGAPRRKSYFNPRSPWGERRFPTYSQIPSKSFQSTLPVGGATPKTQSASAPIPISIHAPRGGSDLFVTLICVDDSGFQSTLPVGGATAYLNTLNFDGVPISIHAPRGGSDDCRCRQRPVCSHFNPRSPWGERLTYQQNLFCDKIFQSTLPVGGATMMAVYSRGYSAHFNPRSPWGERLWSMILPLPVSLFQSTLPVGGATCCIKADCWLHRISIHAPRGGSDQPGFLMAPGAGHFNPRSPWGERRWI